jgi:hypothetical protein
MTNWIEKNCECGEHFWGKPHWTQCPECHEWDARVFQVGDIIFNVAFNSAGGWDWSESFRVTAVTNNFVAAIAHGDETQHNIAHWASSGDGHMPNHRIVVQKNNIDLENIIHGYIVN